MEELDGEKIRIGPLIYTVFEVDRLEDDDHTALNGRIRHDDCEIYIERLIDPQVKLVVLWHEVLHAILDGQGETKHDEGFIEMLAHEIVRVLQDNHVLSGGG